MSPASASRSRNGGSPASLSEFFSIDADDVEVRDDALYYEMHVFFASSILWLFSEAFSVQFCFLFCFLFFLRDLVGKRQSVPCENQSHITIRACVLFSCREVSVSGHPGVALT